MGIVITGDCADENWGTILQGFCPEGNVAADDERRHESIQPGRPEGEGSFQGLESAQSHPG